MQIVYIDFETYYRKKDFALKTAKSTGEYIGTTQIQMMGWAIGDGDVSLAVGEEQIREVVNKIDWSKAAMCSHNTQFDARVLKERFGKIPAFYFDTLAMMRTLHWNQLVGGAKLGHLSKVLQSYGLSIEDKGSEIDEADGKYLFKFKGDIYYMHDQEITAEYLGNLNLTKTGKVKTGKAYKDPKQVVANAIDFYQRFANYCVTDVKICRAGFKAMTKLIPIHELKFQDMITRCALFPQLEMDVPMLRGALHKAQERMREAVNTVANKWFFGRYDDAKAALLSTTKLALVLKAMGGMTQDEIDDYVATEGVQPDVPFIIPTKLSEKETASKGRPVYKYALAKKDPGMAELMENPHPDLQEVLACRKVAVYCNNYEIPRLQRFINEQEYSGAIAMPLKVAGAFTLRLGGDTYNVQNLSSGRNEGQDATMRKAIMAPDNKVVVAVDSSQIEARVLAYIADCISQLDIFSTGGDIYCDMAGAIYNEDPLYIKSQHKAGNADYTYKRQMGKFVILGCIDGESEVLCERGWVKLHALKSDDLLWDGENFVPHKGLIERGEQECINVAGTWLTPDHEICVDGIWEEAQYADICKATTYASSCVFNNEHNNE